MSTNATYTQLRDGSWGIRVPRRSVSQGEAVIVQKKDGTTKVEHVNRVLWSGRDSKSGQTISLCSITGSESGTAAAPRQPQRSRTGSSDRRHCVNCGARLDDYAVRKGYRRCLDCVDGGSNAHGGQSYYDRHGNFVLGDND